MLQLQRVLDMFTMPRVVFTGRGAGNCSPNGRSRMSEKVPILVLLGLGTDERWHASRFAETDETLVVRAAELMGFHVVRVSSDNEELYGIAESLPVGKIFSTGRAFVPFVARAAFDKLRALVDGGAIVQAGSGQPADAVLPSAAMFTTEAA